jgi:Holliday junction resolvase RusA-like endonuclease
VSWQWPPENASMILHGFVPGEAQPGGSKRAGIVTTKSKKDPSKRAIVWVRNPRYESGAMPKVFVTDMSGAPGKRWRKVIQQVVGSLLPEEHDPYDFPLALAVTFWMPRTNKGEWGTGRNAGKLKDSARAFPSVKPDATKLVRAFEDALNDHTWRDDTRVVRQLVQKDYVVGDDPVGAEFALYSLPATMGDVREIAQENLPEPPPPTHPGGTQGLLDDPLSRRWVDLLPCLSTSPEKEEG